MLAVALECLLDLTGAGQYAGNLIAAERVNHEGWAVPPEVFARFFPIVMETVRDALGGDWSGEMEGDWAVLLGRVNGLVAGRT
jgi:hypothetical protein